MKEREVIRSMVEADLHLVVVVVEAVQDLHLVEAGVEVADPSVEAEVEVAADRLVAVEAAVVVQEEDKIFKIFTRLRSIVKSS